MASIELGSGLSIVQEEEDLSRKGFVVALHISLARMCTGVCELLKVPRKHHLPRCMIAPAWLKACIFMQP
jgi:hypothetical protein